MIVSSYLDLSLCFDGGKVTDGGCWGRQTDVLSECSVSGPSFMIREHWC